MTKKLLSLGLLLAGMAVSAQTTRLSLYEEFTGENCGPCANANPALNTLLAANAAKIVSIKWEVPIPSAPSNTWSLYQTNKSDIDWRYKAAPAGYGYIPPVSYAPLGKIDGQSQAVFGATGANVDHPANLNSTIIGTAQSYTSAFSVTMLRAWDLTFSSVNLTITITASAPFTASGNLVFRTVMIEREINFPSPPGSTSEKDFKNVAIAAFPTLQAGVPLAGTWALNQTQTFTLNCPLPSYTRDKAQVAFVGFIQDDGDQKVAQTVLAEKEQFNNDAKAVSVVVPSFSCGADFTPMVTIKNNGMNAITAMTITPYVDGLAQPVYQWSGNLAVGGSTTFPLNAIVPATSGGHDFSYDISSVSGGDNNSINNQGATKFYLVTSYAATPVTEGFVATTFPPASWGVVNPDNKITWSRNAVAGYTPTTGNSAKMDFYNGAAGQKDELIMPPVNLGASPYLTFDVSYAQYTLTPTPDDDKLEIFVSDDCGVNWTSVWMKSGSTLKTAGPITPAFTPTLASQWRKESVSLKGFSGDILVKFVATSDFGNNLYLDNINLKACTAQTVTASAVKTKICVKEKLTITAGGATSYSWASGQTTSSIVVTPSVAGTYTYVVNSNDPGSCYNSGSHVLVVDACTGVSAADNSIEHSMYPNPNKGEFVINAQLNNEKTQLIIYNTVGQKVFEQTLTSDSTPIKAELSKGLYHYELIQAETNVGTGKMVIE
jgi:hypothetical protein